MKRIISVRKTAKEGEALGQFQRGTDGTVKTKIINLLERNPGEDFDFLVDDNGQKSIMRAANLLGEVVNVVDDSCIAEFVQEEDGITVNMSTFEGALPRQSTVDQLERIRKKTKGIDIGDRISDMSGQGANIAYIRNPIDKSKKKGTKGVESIEDFWKANKKFKVNQHLKGFKEFK
jgi:hypothetical protein